MLGEKIRSLRREKGISQEELAEKVGVSRQSISLWENGQTMPSMENTISIADIFGVSTDILLKENIEEKSINTEVLAKRKRGYKGYFIIILSVIIVLAIGATLFVVFSRKNSDKKLTAEEVYSLIAPSTVEINAEGDMFTSTGTGCFIDKNGTVITNYHVIESCYMINVITQDGTVYEVEKVLGFDKERDLAIIKTGCLNSTPIELNISNVKTGEKVYILGSSLGLTGTFSEGIISSASRDIEGFDFIQITAPISSGNSGGPLVDEDGRVIGITTAAFTEGQNLNLAIPAKYINEIKTETTYSVNDFFLLSQGKIVEQTNKESEDEQIIEENYTPVYIGQFDSLKKLEEETQRNPNTFTVPVIVSVCGTIIRTNDDNIYLLDYNNVIGLKLYRAKINGITDDEVKNSFSCYGVFMLDDTQNRVLTSDRVVITGIYRHSAKTLSDCTYEFV